MLSNEDLEFIKFNRTENERTYGYLEARLFKKMIVIFPVIQKRDGDIYVANPSKSVNVMGRWVPHETSFFEKREDRDFFSNIARQFVVDQMSRVTNESKMLPFDQNGFGGTYPQPNTQNQFHGQMTPNQTNAYSHQQKAGNW